MVTLALAQMMFFFYLQAPFTGGEDGIQAVRRGHLFRADRPWPTARHVRRGPRRVHGGIHDPPRDPLALRPGAQGDPRERSRARVNSGGARTGTEALAFVLSAMLSGLAGATKAIVFELASLTD